MLRDYQLGWLRNDVVAGIVLSTMLVPVGIAYAVASGVPAINGLYATIVPLLAYALFGPSRILVLGPDSSLAPIILGVVLAACPPATRAGRRHRRRHGDRGRRRLHPRRRRPARLRHRAALQADPLRLHERHRAGRADQPAAQTVRLLDRKRGSACATCGRSERNLADGKANWAAAALGGGDARPHPRPQGAQKDGRHPARGHRSDGGRGVARPVGALRREGARAGAAGTSRIRPAVAAAQATSSRS